MSSLSLFERFEKTPDPRRPAGTRYSLASILALIVAAVLSGRTSLRAIARWGKATVHDYFPAAGLVVARNMQRSRGSSFSSHVQSHTLRLSG